MEELQALIKELRELIATLKAVPVASVSGAPAGVADLPYPRVVEFEGVKFHLFRPINPKWKPSQYAKIFGKNGQVLMDPSLETTPDGYPSRSPAGYPLTYPFVKDGKPYKPAVILFGDNTFPDDAAVEAYIVATTPTAEDIERARKQWEERDAKVEARNRQSHGTTTPSEPPTNDGVYIV